MAKIGRNEPCPCRSGKKYKRCCGSGEKRVAGTKDQASPQNRMKVTLMDGVRHIQDIAVQKKAAVRDIGVFFFYSTVKGDAWLLEMTDCDCVKLAEDGVALEPPIDENRETIEVNWSHRFRIKNKGLELTAYSDNTVVHLKDAPSKEIGALARSLRKKFSAEQLQQVHLDESLPPVK
ncbi:MAG: preprotein translocase subunit SecA [Proteobacteria bacterium]|nr:MAG: preprotein translocase subunit SecA [Pseudomonadota bacterium]